MRSRGQLKAIYLFKQANTQFTHCCDPMKYERLRERGLAQIVEILEELQPDKHPILSLGIFLFSCV